MQGHRILRLGACHPDERQGQNNTNYEQVFHAKMFNRLSHMHPPCQKHQYADYKRDTKNQKKKKV
jgi:hypothetical protein